MTTNDKGRAVPSGRFARLARFGGMAGGIAGRAAVAGVRQLASGERPTAAGLLLTPANALRITEELSRLRGAAMKMGQLISMDTGDFLPPELSQIMARLRADAQFMPPRQLKQVLDRAWGKTWLSRFEHFDVRPLAAASIGQVHRARTRDGRDLAIKVQYPGVRESIDSDVGNVATLLKLSGLIPASLDVAPLLAEARRQLHEEADYAREAECLARFGALLADSPDFLVPAHHPDLSGADVLAMDFLPGRPVESLADAPQALRDETMTRLMALVLRELFEFRLMQTDPNFANYRYDDRSGRLVLLDFGATRAIPEALAADYRALLRAGLAADTESARHAAIAIGLFSSDTAPDHQQRIMALFETAMAPMRGPALFDFVQTEIAASLRDDGLALAADRSLWHVPPADTLFLQRKLGGLFLLGARLKARIDMGGLLAAHG
ncbi:ABC1 kinase family protein [Polymorphobacter sp.]|uniref:ABC1 kinase family protein n=1 Tax=Polymorphobacter sp. TaxID=1909290 RepID=UPI003F7123C1